MWKRYSIYYYVESICYDVETLFNTKDQIKVIIISFTTTKKTKIQLKIFFIFH